VPTQIMSTVFSAAKVACMCSSSEEDATFPKAPRSNLRTVEKYHVDATGREFCDIGGGGLPLRARKRVLHGFHVVSIRSGRAPDRRLCICTMNAMPNSGVARLTIGIDTNAAMNMPATKTVP
jgi:hypothetical protein